MGKHGKHYYNKTTEKILQLLQYMMYQHLNVILRLLIHHKAKAVT